MRTYGKDIILRVYRIIKSNPEQIFVSTDFGKNQERNRVILNTLVSLKLIEKVRVRYWKSERHAQPCGTTRGYRFLR